MTPSNRQVTSREYKLLLNPERFRARPEGTQAFWNLLVFLAEQQGIKAISKKEDDDKKDDPPHRWVQYLDTRAFELQRQCAIVRLRYEPEKKSHKVTLKYRSPDRYLVAGSDLSCNRKVEKDDLKFEEDILPPFVSKFSASVSFKSDDPVAFVADADQIRPDMRLSHLISLFPGLQALDIPAETPIYPANGFKAYEVMQYIGKLKLADTKLKAALTHWYAQKNEDDYPLMTEFSFDYDLPEAKSDSDASSKDAPHPDSLEQFPLALVRGAHQLFTSLQDYTAWLAPSGTTKTALAFESS